MQDDSARSGSGHKPHERTSAVGRRTLLRRLLGFNRLFSALGLHVVEVTPGVVLASRRRGVHVTPIGARQALVSRGHEPTVSVLQMNATVVAPDPGVTATELGPRSCLLSRERGLRVREVSPGTLLATRASQANRHRPSLEKALVGFLLPHHLMDLFERYGVNCVIDVGGNRGQYGRMLRRAGFRGPIMSFEPVPDLAAKLRDVADGDPLWTVHEVALGREDGRIEIRVAGTGSSALEASEYGWENFPRLRDTPVVEVPLRRLDSLLDELLGDVESPRPFLKLDTQGFDVEVFAGLGDRCAEFVGLQSEVAVLQLYRGSPTMAQSVAAYEQAGFEMTGMFPVTREERTRRVVEFDCVMVRPDTLEAVEEPPSHP